MRTTFGPSAVSFDPTYGHDMMYEIVRVVEVSSRQDNEGPRRAREAANLPEERCVIYFLEELQLNNQSLEYLHEETDSDLAWFNLGQGFYMSEADQGAL